MLNLSMILMVMALLIAGIIQTYLQRVLDTVRLTWGRVPVKVPAAQPQVA